MKTASIAAVCCIALLAACSGGAASQNQPACGAPKSARWQPLLPPAKLPIALMANAVAALESKVYCFGGLDDREFSAKAFVLDPRANEWKRIADMPRGRCFHAAAPVGGKIYIVGGFDHTEGQAYRNFAEVDVYDPATDKWSQAAPLPTPRNRLAAVTVAERIYVLGGMNKANTDIVEVYDPATDKWTAGPRMLSTCHGHAAAAVGDKIYVFGGADTGMTEAAELDTATGHWRKLPAMPEPRLFAAAAAVGDHVYVIGDRDSGDLSLLKFDAKAEKWEIAAEKSVNTHRMGACAIEKFIFVVAGESTEGSRNLDRVSCYDIATRTWHHSK